MIWKKRGAASTIDEVVAQNSGVPAELLLNPNPVSPESIYNLSKVAQMAKDAVKDNENITIVGDYDVDGITSSAILYLLFRRLGKQARVRIPKRLSEGYGMSKNIVDEISSGLVVVVDNGISAINEITMLKEKGVQVCILDHHLPGDTLPPADVIVDQHINPEYSDTNSFRHYCGAGLSHKLTELLFPKDFPLLMRTFALAAIGTVADVATLIGDNRAIVKTGIDMIRKDASIIPALALLNEMSGINLFDEESIGYKIGPILNAGGRMDDNGAMLGFFIMASMTMNEKVKATAENLYGKNEQRKSLMADWERRLMHVVDKEGLYGSWPLCVYDPDVPESIVGPLAGRLAEEFRAPTLIITKNIHDPKTLKGSGRTFGDADLRGIVAPYDHLFSRIGGHTGAIGFSLEEGNLHRVLNSLAEIEHETEEGGDAVLYDLELDGKLYQSINKMELECRKYAPFGAGNPKPIFMMKDVVLSPRYGQHYKFMGSDSSHLKLHADGFDIVGFGQAPKFESMGAPLVVDVVGTLNTNYFQGNESLQVQAIDFVESGSQRPKPTSLMAALAAKNSSFAN